VTGSSVRPPLAGDYRQADRWTERAARVDARARTRGDIVLGSAAGTGYPRYLARAAGSQVWDVDGRQYVDFLIGYGPAILGHAHPEVAAAAAGSAAGGVCIAPFWSPLQVELLELLAEVIPHAERGMLLKTGSDATSAAVRLARIHTGRDEVIHCGYNGWHDWSQPFSTGVPGQVRELTASVRYGSLAELERQFARRPGRVACLVTVPFEDEVIPAGQLAALAELAHANGALFVLDEMRSAFRMTLGGAQSFFGVRADLVVLGKAMANGHPISAVVGRGDVLDCLGRTKISSSYFANPSEMAAALTTIGILRDTDALTTIWRTGELFIAGLRELVARAGLPAAAVGYPPMPFLAFDAGVPAGAVHAFYRRVAEAGVLLHPDHQWFVSAAHTEDDVARALAALATAAESFPADLAGCS
jgi:glutamate-1-semialdehyde 2,1-aminomutase